MAQLWVGQQVGRQTLPSRLPPWLTQLLLSSAPGFRAGPGELTAVHLKREEIVEELYLRVWVGQVPYMPLARTQARGCP